MIGRSQLFTENTITPVSVVLTEFNVLPNMLWLWAVVFVANVLDTIVFAAALVYGDVFTTRGLKILFDEATTKLKYGFWLTPPRLSWEVGSWRSWPGR
jgi:formate-nitrite transporter family protein